MNRNDLVNQLQQQRQMLGLTLHEVAARSGLTEKSVRNALSPLGNPRLSSWLALIDALALEVQLLPLGFGAPASADDANYQPVPTLVGSAVQRKTGV